MSRIVVFAVLLLSILSVLSGCKKDEDNVPVGTTENLEQFGILAEWKLETRIINGISDLLIQCCDFIVFNPDDRPDDLKGEFTATGVGYETNGVFEIDTSNNIIQFDYNSSQRSFEFQVLDSLVTFTYEENNQDIIEIWRKED